MGRGVPACNRLIRPVSPAEGSGLVVDENFAAEIIEAALKMGADVFDGLVVDAGADQGGHPVDNLAGAEGADFLVKVTGEHRLDLFDEALTALGR